MSDIRNIQNNIEMLLKRIVQALIKINKQPQMPVLQHTQRNVEVLLLKIALLLEKLESESISNGFFLPTISADTDAPNNSIYYSTTQSKLVYKDSLSVVNDLY